MQVLDDGEYRRVENVGVAWTLQIVLTDEGLIMDVIDVEGFSVGTFGMLYDEIAEWLYNSTMGATDRSEDNDG